MRSKKKSFLLLIIFIIVVTCSVFARSASTSYLLFYPNFHDNICLNAKMRISIAPYLLPLDHPSKPILDSIFSNTRATESTQSLIDSNFEILADNLDSHVILARHPAVPGYLFKIYLDSETKLRYGLPPWEMLVKRCKGASDIRKVIKKKKIRHFTVPDKWLYILPPSPPSKGIVQQPVLLIETDMKIKNLEETKKAWKEVTTKEHLDELYYILKTETGATSPRNVPYTEDGKFAFIDTERYNNKHDFNKVNLIISDELKEYWKKVCEENTK